MHALCVMHTQMKLQNVFCAMQAERWALIGNAVTVPVAKWLGTRLMQPYRYPVIKRFDHVKAPTDTTQH